MNERSAERHAVWVPVQVSGESGEVTLGVSDDVSEGGVQIVSPVVREVGSKVDVALHFPDGTKRTVTGEVVRVEPNEDPDGLFPHRVAVAFAERVEGLESLLVEVESLT
ncbi:MAG: PilZ domain-containing protein [Myxococcota bacterium]|nr:PilZ domain-containing protein [Myxococcota bacterium]